MFDGAEAERMGLVAEAVPPAEVVPRAVAMATEIASQSPIAVQSLIRSLRMGHDDGLDAALQREALSAN